MTLYLSNSYSPPYTLSSDPVSDPSNALIDVGAANAYSPVSVLSVEKVNGQSTTAFVLSAAVAATTPLALNGDIGIPDKS